MTDESTPSKSQNLNDRNKRRWLVMGVLFAIVAGLFGGMMLLRKQAVVPAATEAPSAEYKVKKGEFLIKIAKRAGVPWQAVMLINEQDLLARADERCSKLSEKYVEGKTRRGKTRRGYYCNEALKYRGKQIAFANSLKPGDTLRLPSAPTPTTISDAVQHIAGKNVVIVIDDSGSMGDTREQVGAWYAKEIEDAGKDITKVVLYADGQVRTYESGGGIEFLTTGNFENTRNALTVAKGLNPDAIVLISDEPGDDWGNWDLTGFPPIVAHSLDAAADENLRRAANLTRGQFLGAGSSPIATR